MHDPLDDALGGACPFDEDLPAYLQGELSPERALDVSEHVDGCPACSAELTSLRGLLSELDELNEAPPQARADLGDRVLAAIRIVVLTPFRRLGPSGLAWSGMAVASIVLLLLIKGPFAGEAPSAATHRAVVDRDAAQWLLGAQALDGSWEPTRFGGRERWRVGLSGLALYAVVAAHADPPAEALDRAVAFLLRQQAANGRLGPESVDDLYNHAPATLALQAVLASHPVPELAAAVRRAVDHVVVRQGASGGWGYADTPSSPNTVISGWPLEVLLRARAAGRGDLEEPIARARAWLASMVDRSGRAGYDRRGAFPQGVATPTAIVVGLDPEARWPGGMDIPMDLFGIYFLSANAGNNDVKMSIRRRLGDLQSRSGANAGSFLPSDRWSADGGRIYATAMGVLSWSRL